MNLAHNSSKTLICGASGQGKSTYFARFVHNAYRTIYGKIFLFDHVGEMSVRLNVPPALNEDDLAQQWEAGFVCFDPAYLFPGETDTAWNFFCEWTFDRCRFNLGTPKLLCVDELQMFSSTAQLSWEQCCVVETGRKYELDFLAISQQMNLIHNRLRNQLTEIVSFKQTDALILDALEERGFDPHLLTNLGKGEYLVRNFQNGANLRGKIDLTGGGNVSASEHSQPVNSDSGQTPGPDESEDDES